MRAFNILAGRAYSVIMFGALFCTLAVKLFHARRTGHTNEYFDWILNDISFLLLVEVVLSLVCFRWPQGWVVRTATVIAAIVCTWSVMNAGWLIRNGMQILPTTILPLFRDPLNSFGIVGDNLAKMPAAAVILLGPSAIALGFFFWVLARPQPPNYNRKRFFYRALICLIIVISAGLARRGAPSGGSAQRISEELRYNCQLRALMGPFLPKTGRVTRTDLTNAKREIPTLERLGVRAPTKPRRLNVVIVVLEGIQYRYTSLVDAQENLTPYLAELARQGVELGNARTSLSHTTKALFGLLTGHFPSASYDIVEAVPVLEPYGGLAGILKERLGFRTAFFQSAKGSFESRAGLVYNLGFDKFWSRESLKDPNTFLGSLASDEFSMLEPVREWMKADDRPFLLTILCSVTHDSYEVPKWFAEPAKEPVERYRQAINYTDRFIAALDEELAKLNLTEKSIFCVIGDHGEAFGEHGLHGHERIAFEEVLRIPWVMRAPFLIERGRRVISPVSSVDLTPTLLTLFGFDISSAGFDGTDALGPLAEGRRVYFSDWKHVGPAGFVNGNHKFVYNPVNRKVFVYDLGADPNELAGVELDGPQAMGIASEILNWRKDSIFQLNRERRGKMILFGNWLCRWNSRDSVAKYLPAITN